MNRTIRLATIVGMLVTILGLGASNAAASSVQYDFNVKNGFIGGGSAPYGQLTLTQTVANDVLVIVELFNGLRFVSAFDVTVGFNLDGIGAVTYSGVPSGWTIPDEVGSGGQNAGAYNVDGFGQYEFGLNSPGNGGSLPQNSPITFHVSATGITLASFVELSSHPPGTGAYFAADVIGADNGTVAGTTGAIAIIASPHVVPECTTPPCSRSISEVPEPGTLLLLGSGLAVAVRRLRRRAA